MSIKEKEKNLFGGGNHRSLYVPMSELEQEAVSRLVESQDLRVNLVGWGYVDNPRITFGDARIQIRFSPTFTKPEVPVPVHELELELVVRSSGRVLFRDKKSVEYDGRPIQIAAGVYFEMVWDIMIRSIDPRLVKELVPGATGLTSRLVDKDTGDVTHQGNMRLTTHEKRVLNAIRQAENRVRGKKR